MIKIGSLVTPKTADCSITEKYRVAEVIEGIIVAFNIFDPVRVIRASHDQFILINQA